MRAFATCRFTYQPTLDTAVVEHSLPMLMSLQQHCCCSWACAIVSFSIGSLPIHNSQELAKRQQEQEEMDLQWAAADEPPPDDPFADADVCPCTCMWSAVCLQAGIAWRSCQAHAENPLDKDHWPT